MTSVVIGAVNVVPYPEGGGHFWVCMQYVQGFRALGCQVSWLERVPRTSDAGLRAQWMTTFLQRAGAIGVDDVLLYESDASGQVSFLQGPPDPWRALEAADLLLNFDYSIAPPLLERARLSALVDIDPGLLQFWVSAGQLSIPDHDRYLTTGETVGRPGSLIPDVGLVWHSIRPPVSLRHWPVAFDGEAAAFTTVSSWWGGRGAQGEWISDGAEVLYENTKRVSFLKFVELPRRTTVELELALDMGAGDGIDRELLRMHGWKVTPARAAAASPEAYQRYIQASRGEFSCAKPSCMRFQNAWVSDRSVCYLASGKPVVVQDTGPSRFLPSGEGMFRFSTLEEAVQALEAIEADYERQCQAARALAETHFDARKVAAEILEAVL